MLKHKHFEMGTAPYRFVGMFSFPSTSLAEQNPSAYNNMMAGKPKCARGLCDHCGMGIVHHYMIRDAEGNKFSVGSECIKKIGDVENMSLVEHQKKEHQKALRKARADAKREAQRIYRETKMQAERDRNGGLTDYEVNQQMIRDEAQAQRDAVASKVAYFVDHLSADGFAGDLRRGIIDGRMPTGRGLTIMLEIIAKTAGRKNSKAYNAKYEEAELELIKTEEALS